MRKKTILGTILTLSILVAAFIAAMAPAFAAQQDDPSIVNYGVHGRVTFLLPPAGGQLATRPSSLGIVAWDFDKRSETGPFDYLYVQVWAPAINAYMPVAAVFDIPVPDWYKKMWNSTSMGLYTEINGVVTRNNCFSVGDKELEVTLEKGSSGHGYGQWGWDEYGRCVWNTQSGEILRVNLTKPLFINATFPAAGNVSFTLPPMSMTFAKTAEGFYNEVSSNLPSSWKQIIKGTQEPAWVDVIIPSWVMLADVPATYGHLYSSAALINVPPAS